MVSVDQLGRPVTLAARPQKIISLVPSQTELLYDLGLEQEVAGITKFCIHPDSWYRHKTRVGGTKNINHDLIRSIRPDLIIGNKEENDQSQLETLMEEFPVWISDVNDLDSALQMIRSIGEITDRQKKSAAIAGDIQQKFEDLQIKTTRLQPTVSSAYFIWRQPWMVAGNDTFIHHMMAYCGLTNCFSAYPRYPEISLAQLKEKKCEVILLSSEPFPFKEKHAAEVRQVIPTAKILLVDGEMFSWYGSRLLQAPDYFARLADEIHSSR